VARARARRRGPTAPPCRRPRRRVDPRPRPTDIPSGPRHASGKLIEARHMPWFSVDVAVAPAVGAKRRASQESDGRSDAVRAALFPPAAVIMATGGVQEGGATPPTRVLWRGTGRTAQAALYSGGGAVPMGAGGSRPGHRRMRRGPSMYQPLGGGCAELVTGVWP